MISDVDRKVIKDTIAPLLRVGDLSLLLGAGFSIVNVASTGKPLPSGDSLIDRILAKAGKARGPKTTLKDAYQLGKREITAFEEFLAECFTVSIALPWQERIFSYPWNRIYTTNIDNVLSLAATQADKKGISAGDFRFFNYVDPSLAGELVGSIPVVSIHGTCLQLDKGFVFSGIEYAVTSIRVLDWHRDLAARALVGGLVVIGNQLDESDFDVYLASRQADYPAETAPRNWIVLKGPDPIKADNYRASGFHVIDCTAEEFFSELFSHVKPRSVGDVVLDTVPAVKKAATHRAALTWFKRSMSSALTEMEDARQSKGVLRHFLTGSDPDWFYIANHAHADLSIITSLTGQIGDLLRAADRGVQILHVLGPSGSGKTTALRAALSKLLSTYPYIYEFRQGTGLDPDLLCDILATFTEKSVITFTSASEFYYAIDHVAKKLERLKRPLCVFVLEDRTNDHKRNKRHIEYGNVTKFDIEALPKSDARLLAKKLEDSGVVFENFSEFPLDRRAEMIVHQERGFNGDLLSALFSLSAHENFEQKIFAEYYSVKDDLAKKIFDIVIICHSLGHAVPISTLSSALGASVEEVYERLSVDLDGVLAVSNRSGGLRCRHRVIASYYFNECLSGNGTVDLLVGLLGALSRQFSIGDIRYHPLPYLIYKNIIAIEFMEQYFPPKGSRADTESTLHAAQRFFGKDGLFWLQYGRYYRKAGQLNDAISCFRTGLTFFESFQTRHTLALALLEKYVAGHCTEDDLYSEGVATLDEQRYERGATDPYPVTTELDQLLKILAVDPQHADAGAKAKECVNFGLQYFAQDAKFVELMKRYVAVKGK